MRKTARITIDKEGRDKGKVFELTEMPAFQAERWANRLIFAIMNAGVDIPQEMMTGGMAAIASAGPVFMEAVMRALSQVPYDVAEPLIEELMACVQIVPDPSKQIVRALNMDASDIEELSTIYKLKWETIKLHTDFFTDAAS